MNIKKLLALLIALVMCFLFVACNSNDSDDSSNYKKSSTSSCDELQKSSGPLLYRVTDDDGDVVWLFGSIHVGREEFYPLPDYVLDAFDNSDALAVECDVKKFEKDFTRQYKVLSKLVYSDRTTIKDHISDELYESSVAVFKELGLYNSAFDYYIPIFWSQAIESALLEMYGANTKLGIDLHLMDRASESDKEILEIESVEFQYQMLADFSEELQILLLQQTIESYSSDQELENELNDMMDLWASGDEKAFAEYLTDDTSELTGEELELYNEYNDAMIVNRNNNTADFAEDALDSGDEVFICVGAAHVIGDGGMADLLEERGYNVEIVR